MVCGTKTGACAYPALVEFSDFLNLSGRQLNDHRSGLELV